MREDWRAPPGVRPIPLQGRIEVPPAPGRRLLPELCLHPANPSYLLRPQSCRGMVRRSCRPGRTTAAHTQTTKAKREELLGGRSAAVIPVDSSRKTLKNDSTDDSGRFRRKRGPFVPSTATARVSCKAGPAFGRPGRYGHVHARAVVSRLSVPARRSARIRSFDPQHYRKCQ